ncbi:Hypothetical predicted protein [Lecanosticta acicola]|uniref:Uncharacterized protein n=1 Tax=Lecanosticta acicola TaxID=111012 RepID=A0AAI8YZN1_9PEZI|nr:Hypothetical predicted protein [Lecanosticta acicola]
MGVPDSQSYYELYENLGIGSADDVSWDPPKPMRTAPRQSDEDAHLIVRAGAPRRSAAAASSEPIPPSTFLEKIPVEIRLAIYEVAMAEGDAKPETITSRKSAMPARGDIVNFPWYVVEPPILRVCRQIRAEAMKTYNNFLSDEQARVVRSLAPDAEERASLMQPWAVLLGDPRDRTWEVPQAPRRYLQQLADAAQRVRRFGYLAPESAARPFWDDMIDRTGGVWDDRIWYGGTWYGGTWYGGTWHVEKIALLREFLG